MIDGCCKIQRFKRTYPLILGSLRKPRMQQKICGKNGSWDSIRSQALLYRLRNLAIIGEPCYKQWCININKLGWRRKEPADMPPEKPSWLRQSILRALGEDLISRKTAENIIGSSFETGEPLSLVERRAFMKLPLEERRRIMAKQAERMAAHYENDREWRKFQGGD
jgi:hypothetical protein